MNPSDLYESPLTCTNPSDLYGGHVQVQAPPVSPAKEDASLIPASEADLGGPVGDDGTL